MFGRAQGSSIHILQGGCVEEHEAGVHPFPFREHFCLLIEPVYFFFRAILFTQIL